MIYTVGLTGGIGSGKTFAANIFSTFDIPVFYADDEAKKLYDTSETLRKQLIGLLGEDIYIGTQLQRKVMAGKIFSDNSLLQKVNQLVHPLLGECFVAFASQQQSPYVVMEAAVLFEGGLNRSVNKVITVNAPEQLRIQRVMQRDKVTEDTVRQRMQHQWTDEQRASQSNFIITNDEKEPLLPQVITIHEKILSII